MLDLPSIQINVTLNTDLEALTIILITDMEDLVSVVLRLEFQDMGLKALTVQEVQDTVQDLDLKALMVQVNINYSDPELLFKHLNLSGGYGPPGAFPGGPGFGGPGFGKK